MVTVYLNTLILPFLGVILGMVLSIEAPTKDQKILKFALTVLFSLAVVVFAVKSFENLPRMDKNGRLILR